MDIHIIYLFVLYKLIIINNFNTKTRTDYLLCRPRYSHCHGPQAKSQLREMAEEHDEKSPPFVVPGGKAVEECEDMIRRSLRHPTVKFLKEHLEKAGCAVGDNFIKAVHCHEQISGGFVRGTGVFLFYFILVHLDVN
ncbi:hypothetical protein Pint_02865 [Pistacia integerrima]|uniref:Uncharacterized protein n=1 Tax=Pistacia integerrima TaxID=434235 RepID=A0ACC0ZHG2_9ROSI|nr:hypothetical protein Pint_02865 [Pistacia integerrima]